MSEYPRKFDDIQSFDRLINILRLVMRRLLQNPKSRGKDTTPLDNRERRVLNIVSKKLTHQIESKPEAMRADAEGVIQEAKAVMGERQFLDFFLVQPKVLGVTFSWFIIEAIVSVALSKCTDNSLDSSIVFLVAAAILHISGYFICGSKLKQQREESLKKLLGESF